MDFEEYESLPTNNFSIHMTAGAIAGVMEHCVMYPLDSVKVKATKCWKVAGVSRYQQSGDYPSPMQRPKGPFFDHVSIHTRCILVFSMANFDLFA